MMVRQCYVSRTKLGFFHKKYGQRNYFITCNPIKKTIKALIVVFICNHFFSCSPSQNQNAFYEVTKVENYSGIKISKELLNRVCLKRLINRSGISLSYSHTPFNPGSSTITVNHSDTFFDLFEDGKLVISDKVDLNSPVLITKWGGEKMHWFPYRGSSDSFSPKNSILFCKTRVSGKRGRFIIDFGDNRSISLLVKECSNIEGKQLLDLKSICDDYYPFKYKFFSVDGIISYNDRINSSNLGYDVIVDEAVKVHIAVSANNQFYILGFRCIKQNSGQITPFRRDAGFKDAVPLYSAINEITCATVKDTYFHLFPASSFMLSFDLSNISFSNINAEDSPLFRIYSNEIKIIDIKREHYM